MANMFIIKETQPENLIDGQCWYKPSIGQLFMQINAEPRPFVASGSLLSFIDGYNIFIRTENKTDLIDDKHLKIKDVLTYKVDTLKFRLWDDDGTNRPEIGYEVWVFYKTPSTGIVELVYGGNIITMPQQQISDGSYTYYYDITCADYGRELKTKLVNDVYENQTTAAIIADVIDNNANEFTYNNVETGITITFIAFPNKTVWEVLIELAELNHMDFYIDQYKDIHFHARTTNVSPFSITDDNTTTGKFKNLVISSDKSQYRNFITVQGGDFLSPDFDDIQTVVANDTIWPLKYTPFKSDSGSVDIFINASPGFAGFVQKTVGIDNIVSAGKDFLLNKDAQNLKPLDYSVNADDILKVVYKYKIPINTEDEDSAAIADTQAKEGGTGIRKYAVSDSTIRTIQAAHDRANAELLKYANPIVKGSFRTSQAGYRSGQLLPITSVSRGYTDTYLIQSVETKIMANLTREFKIVFATINKDFYDLLTELVRLSRAPVIREDETVHKLIVLTESISVIDEVDFDLDIPYQYQPGSARIAKYNATAGALADSTGVYA